jgi:hypothetical protein
MSLQLLSNPVREGASAFVLYKGTPNRRVVWSLTGPGNLAAVTEYTDATGCAAAIFTPDAAGDTVTIEVNAGA